jgi:hypothetical protein
MSRREKWVAGTVAVVLAATLAAPAALANPPAYAPAHGWRAQQQPYYAAYDRYGRPVGYDTRRGSCNGDGVGAVLGAVGGGLIGGQVAKGDNQTIGILTGAAIGGLLGYQIGRSSDPDCGRPSGVVQYGVPVRGYYPTVRGSYPRPAPTYVVPVRRPAHVPDNARRVYVVPARHPVHGATPYRDANRRDQHRGRDVRDNDNDRRDHRERGDDHR